MTGPVTALSVHRLVVNRSESVLAGPISFDVAAGATVGLSGPSGSGKSTVLRALVGLLPAPLRATGDVRVLGVTLGGPGVDLPGLRSRAALVGQAPVAFPMSIMANAVFGLRHVRRASRAELRARAEAALTEAGLWTEVADRLDHPADQLSIGQRQRLCLARALALDPAVLLLDEPTSALDDEATAAVESAIAGLRGRRTVLIVSHDSAQLARMCDDVVILGPQPSAVGLAAVPTAVGVPARSGDGQEGFGIKQIAQGQPGGSHTGKVNGIQGEGFRPAGLEQAGFDQNP